MVLGPLLLIILKKKYETLNFARNLKIWGNNKFTYMTHLIFYINLIL